MKLNHISEEACPHCGAGPVSERIGSSHVHERCGRDETRSHACGRTVSYSKNFMGIRVDADCPKSPYAITLEKITGEVVKDIERVFKKHLRKNSLPVQNSNLDRFISHDAARVVRDIFPQR